MAMHYGPIMVDVQGTALKQEEKELLKHPGVGGVLLFSRNYSSKDQIKDLVQEIRNAAHHPLLIAVDHEGGRVWRFKEGFTKLKPARDYGLLYENNQEQAFQTTKQAGFTMAAELLDCGIDLSFAPVLDIDRGLSEVIGDRAFHRDPHIIALLAKAFIEGMNQAGMKATGKHFPGHGGLRADTHFKEAIDKRTLEILWNEDIVPFASLAKILGGIMPAHVIYPEVDSVPAGYSHIWLKDILRKKLGFEGAIISDCLSMKAAAIGGDYILRARMAIDAGCDLVILCQQSLETLNKVLDKLDRSLDVTASNRLKALQGDFSRKKAVSYS